MATCETCFERLKRANSVLKQTIEWWTHRWGVQVRRTNTALLERNEARRLAEECLEWGMDDVPVDARKAPPVLPWREEK